MPLRNSRPIRGQANEDTDEDEHLSEDRECSAMKAPKASSNPPSRFMEAAEEPFNPPSRSIKATGEPSSPFYRFREAITNDSDKLSNTSPYMEGPALDEVPEFQSTKKGATEKLLSTLTEGE